ncbi:MAG TPA: CDP-diacylglycerol--glycerol-3-phosphate 3-phosphatidyltransferase [Nitrospirae bacterium]|nr:CDP-diacylglycerol--glycerol-3-phosphate 3-phosphatidyltransferase [bacterium BMS3Abin08]HDY71074.1 CDP-diacylglycerol--glycerol-3-phosphate 3-phosphatidyltransferase [Nitrospirota bacterium]
MVTVRLNLPTILTLSRIVFIPFFIVAAPDHPVLGAVIFSIASLTDFLDGYIARRTGQVTKFGIILDPIADKFLVITALVLLVEMESLSSFVAIIIIIREFLVTGLRVVALTRDIVIPAETGGKLKTTTQIFAILALLLKNSFFGINLYLTGTILIWLSLLLAVFSGIKYTFSFWKEMT